MKHKILLSLLLFSPLLLTAQSKTRDGTVPGGSIMPLPGAIYELESINKGLLLTRLPLTNTTTWGLLGTATAGMTVFNTNAGITSTNPFYPKAPGGIGQYYWDGTGWVAIRYANEPWFKQGSSNQASENTDNIYQMGSVAIGSNSIPLGYKLSIKGSGIAEQLVVKLNADWPDYVFKSGYELRSLAEVENYVKEYAHLPEIPSAQQVIEHGQNLGEMNRLLLQKVEELTLYLINQNKTLEAQAKDIAALKKEINGLKK